MRGCKATAQGLIHRVMAEEDIRREGGLATGKTGQGGHQAFYLPSSLSGTSSQVRQRGKSDRGPPSCPPSPAGCPSLPTAHCVFRATVSTRAGSLPGSSGHLPPVQLTGRQRQQRSPSNIDTHLRYSLSSPMTTVEKYIFNFDEAIEPN